METAKTSLICGFMFVLASLAPLHAQNVSTDSNAAPSTPVAARAPDEMTKKITDLVNAGKYPEAQALTTGLLVAYPNDERLIKTQALLKQLVPTAAVLPPRHKPFGSTCYWCRCWTTHRHGQGGL